MFMDEISDIIRHVTDASRPLQ